MNRSLELCTWVFGRQQELNSSFPDHIQVLQQRVFLCQLYC